MMSTIEEELMEDFRQVIADHPEVDLECENAAYVKEIFSVLEKNREICQAFMGEHGDMAFVYRLEELIAEHSVRLFKSQHPEICLLYTSFPVLVEKLLRDHTQQYLLILCQALLP